MELQRELGQMDAQERYGWTMTAIVRAFKRVTKRIQLPAEGVSQIAGHAIQVRAAPAQGGELEDGA